MYVRSKNQDRLKSARHQRPGGCYVYAGLGTQDIAKLISGQGAGGPVVSVDCSEI